MPSVADIDEFRPLIKALSAASDITQGHDALDDFMSSGPVVNSTPDGSIAGLAAALRAAAEGPDAEVKGGSTPMPRNVGIMPYTEGKAVENYAHLVDISSIVSLYTAIWSADARGKRGHPQPYDITIASEAAQSFADMASSAYNVMGGPLAGLFNYANGATTTFTKKMSKTEVHLEFLGELFKGFSLTKPALMQLDGILTNFVSSLKTVNVETGSTKNNVDQTLRVNQVMRLNIAGDEANPIWVFQPRTRIVYMHIDASTWHWATNKAEHTSNTFNMTYTVADFDLNVNKWLASKEKFDTIFKTIVGKSMSEYGKMINPSPINPSA